MSRSPEMRLGLVGAGTMGAGIAEVAALRGVQTTLCDASPEALAAAGERIAAGFAKTVERGRCSAADADAAQRRLSFSAALESLSGSDVVIEAIAERLEVKRELFSRLREVCPAPALLATNTSSLRVSALASAIPEPERVIGMHFFNPVSRMRLVEVVPGTATSAAAVERARRLGEALGKQVIVAADGIGFLVNRCARPFAGEALRLVSERIASPEQVDRICRMAGGFRMGPFELLDLIGLDVNLEISESFWFQSYGEPRWRPSPLQARLVDAGRLGRKTGLGFYSYADGPHRPADPDPPSRGGGDGRVVAIGGAGAVARALRERAIEAGFAVCYWGDEEAAEAWLAVDAEPRRWLRTSASGPARTRLCACGDLHSAGDPPASGFHLIGPVGDAVELTSLESTDAEADARTRAFFTALGFHLESVGDAPGLVLGRIVAQLVNEAAFAIGEGVGSAADVDTGTTLGLNYPRGPLAWAEEAGPDHVREILLALHTSRGEERYRMAPGLRRLEPMPA